MRRLVVTAALLAAAVAPGTAAATGAVSPFHVRLIAHDSAPGLAVLRRMAVRHPIVHSFAHGAPPGNMFDVTPFAGPRPSSPGSPAVASAMPAPTLSFDGMTNTSQSLESGVLLNPPDTDGDVGPNDYVQLVNAAFSIYDKTGALLSGPTATNTLWAGMTNACATHDDGDGVVLYDRPLDRWVVTQFAVVTDSVGNPRKTLQCVAVSQTGDPVSGGWYRYVFDEGAVFADYPKLGVWRSGYFLSTNLYSISTGNFLGGGLLALDRTRMANPALGAPRPAVGVRISGVYGLLPADVDGPTVPAAGEPEYFVAPLDLSSGDRLDLVRMNPQFGNGTASVSSIRLAAGSFNLDLCKFGQNFACIPQPSPGERLDALGGGQTMDRVVYLNQGGIEKLLVTFTVKTSAGRAGIRWNELQNAGAGWHAVQAATFAPADGRNRWIPSIAMDKDGDIAIGYSIANASLDPTIRYAGRLATDPAGQLAQGETRLQAGTGVQTNGGNRWGDYSAMSVDPSDDCTFWYTNEYYASNSGERWGTRIGTFKFPSCI